MRQKKTTDVTLMPPAQPPTEDPPPEAPATGNPNDKRALRSPLLDHKISDFKNFLIFIDSLKFLHFQLSLSTFLDRS